MVAQVWDACKWNDDVTGRPNHELDTLRGHEHDVNYVQFRCVFGSAPHSSLSLMCIARTNQNCSAAETVGKGNIANAI